MQRSRIAAAAWVGLALAVPAATVQAAGDADKQLAACQAELTATERTLAEAAQAVKDPKLSKASADAFATRLEQHRSRLATLREEILAAEAANEERRNQEKSKFQEADRKANVAMQQLAQLLRALNEIRGSATNRVP